MTEGFKELRLDSGKSDDFFRNNFRRHASRLGRNSCIWERGPNRLTGQSLQRKRLAMVAAMMEDKPIYMFDEWAADQDPEFRQYFYEALLPSFKAEGKTVIAVSHDDRYFHVADRVIKLDYGQIAAEPDSADI